MVRTYKKIEKNYSIHNTFFLLSK